LDSRSDIFFAGLALIISSKQNAECRFIRLGADFGEPPRRRHKGIGCRANGQRKRDSEMAGEPSSGEALGRAAGEQPVRAQQ